MAWFTCENRSLRSAEEIAQLLRDIHEAEGTQLMLTRPQVADAALADLYAMLFGPESGLTALRLEVAIASADHAFELVSALAEMQTLQSLCIQTVFHEALVDEKAGLFAVQLISAAGAAPGLKELVVGIDTEYAPDLDHEEVERFALDVSAIRWTGLEKLSIGFGPRVGLTLPDPRSFFKRWPGLRELSINSQTHRQPATELPDGPTTKAARRQ